MTYFLFYLLSSFLLSHYTDIYEGILIEVERLVGFLESVQREDGRFSKSDFEDILVLSSLYSAERIAHPKSKIHEHFPKIIRKADENGLFSQFKNSKDPKARFKYYKMLVYTNSMTREELDTEVKKIDWKNQNDIELFAIAHETSSFAGVRYDFLCEKIENFLERFVQNPNYLDLQKVYFILQSLSHSTCDKFEIHSPFIFEIWRSIEKLEVQNLNFHLRCMYFDIVSQFRSINFEELKLFYDTLKKVRTPKEVAICIEAAVKTFYKRK